jgi:hypothetical protein
MNSSDRSLLFGSLHPQEQFVLGRDLVLRVHPVIEVYPGQPAVRVHPDPHRLDVVGPEGPLAEVRQVE